MSNYSNGARFERFTRHDLEANGYEVIRSAGSKGKVDLVAFKMGQILFVQNKINGLCAPAERAALRTLAGMVGALPIVAYSVKEGRAAATVGYRLLTGDGPKAFCSWTPDQVEERCTCDSEDHTHDGGCALYEPTDAGSHDMAGEAPPPETHVGPTEAETWVAAADFLRDAHFRDGLSAQEIGAAMRHHADSLVPSAVR